MVVHSIRIYARDGRCLFQHDFTPNMTVVDHKTMFGFLFAMKAFANQLTPIVLGEQENEPILSYCTDAYRLHYLEVCTGIRIIMITDLVVPDQRREIMKKIYTLFCNDTSKNAAYEYQSGTVCPKFSKRLQDYVQSLTST